MRIEVWVLVALVAVLAVYLLPFLVGRREVMRLSNADDRYSSELRILATGDALAADEACVSTGHAQIFRRRPEVKAMNRPAVRNVRAVRIERELVRARRAHDQARERRRVAASHRAAVACTLVGTLLGTVVVCSLTAVPWLCTILPALLLALSMGAGRRAALRSAALDRRERGRIAELERELTDIAGHRPARAAAAAPQRAESARTTASSPARGAQERASVGAEGREGLTAVPDPMVAGSDGAVDDAGVGEGAVAFGSAVGTESAESAEQPGAATSFASFASAGSDEASGAVAADEAEVPAGPVVARGAASADDAPSRRARGADVGAPPARRSGHRGRDEHRTGPAVQHALRAVAWPVTALTVDSENRDERAASALAEAPVPGPSEAAGAAQTPVREPATTTPPQGWHPVHVPAPTYTLAARAPRRALEDLEEVPAPSAPVPARPHSVRMLPTEGVEREEIEFHPIDLDAVLEKRRAAGA